MRARRFCCVYVCAALASATADATDGVPGIWTSAAELAELPNDSRAWNAVLATALQPPGVPNISLNNDAVSTQVMAKALVYARTCDEQMRDEVISLCMAVIGTELNGSTLMLGRNLLGYVIAADLVELPPAEHALFRSWLLAVRDTVLLGRTLRTTNEDRPNNWGTHAGASRAAIAIYLGDSVDLHATATIFKGWLGDRESYAGFEYGALWWQADPEAPVGINPVGSMIDGHSVDGVLPDDQRRGGPFTWPPPQENYVYEALQGALAQAVILSRRGYPVWSWEDQALLRAFRWLDEQANFPANGDDTWQPHVVNYVYQTCFQALIPSTPGKNVGFTDWTHRYCLSDMNDDGIVSSADLLALLSLWGGEGSCDEVTAEDLLQLLTEWGVCG